MNMLMKLMGAASIAALAGASASYAEVSDETLKSLGAPDKMETSAGTLEFKDGVPSDETASKVYDTLDFTRALNVYNNSFRGASALAIKKGMESVGAGSGDIVIFEQLMDANSLFLTANADTVYYLGWIDLSKGPVVIEQPSDGLGAINDMWFSWVIDMGKPGPDRGLGGKYLIVGPGYDGPLPAGRLFRGPCQDQYDPLCPAGLHQGRQRPEARGRQHQAEPEDLSLCGRQLWNAHRRGTGRKGQAGRRAEDPRDEVHRCQRDVVQHHSAQRLWLLRDDQRERPERARHQL